jgi:F-type H+-transporting ATPase subunit b
MKSSDANLKRNGVCTFLRRHVAPLLFCAALLSMLTTPGFLMAQTDANASGATVTAQTPHQARMQAERRAEIRQRKIDNPEAEEGENVYRHSATVKKLAGAFGLSVETTSRLFEIINFVLLLALIVWGIAKLLPKTLRARTERIRSEIEQARMATEDANRRLSSVEERLSRLDSEIETIRTQAEHETALEEQRLRAAMEQEKKSILDSATQNINAATKNAQSLLKKLAADLVIEHARRQIAISPETDRTLVTGFLADVSDKQPRGGVN